MYACVKRSDFKYSVQVLKKTRSTKYDIVKNLVKNLTFTCTFYRK